MEFYVGLFLITTLGCFAELLAVSDTKKKLIFWVLILLFIFISAIRWTNPDWDVYYPLFVEPVDFEDFTNRDVEAGYGAVNWFVRQFSDDFSVLLGSLAVVIIGLFAGFMRMFSPYPLLSLLYWFGTYMGEIFFNRQALAIAITLLSFRFIVKKKPIPFVILVLVAASVQVSVIFFLLAYPLYHMRTSFLFLVMMVVFSVVAGSFFDASFLLSVGAFLHIITIDQERLMNKVFLYYNWGEEESGNVVLGFVRRLLFLPIELWTLRYMSRLSDVYRGCINLIVMGYSISFFLRNVSPIVATRIASPFYMYEIITIPALFLFVKSLYMRVIFFFLLVAYSFVKYMYAIDLYRDIYIPFVHILS